MRLLAAALVLAALSRPASVRAAQPGAFADGFEARRLLGAGLKADVSLEEAHASGARAALALQGSRKGDATGEVQAGSGSSSVKSGRAGKGPSLKVNEPPAPGKPGETPPPPKPKLDWGKTIKKWLPIVIGVVASVQLILNPVGSATFWVRNFALIAALGTGKQLINELRKKT